MADYLVDLERDQRSCEYCGEPLGPAFFQPETGALGEKQAGIKEADNSHTSNFVGREVGGLLQGFGDVLFAGIYAEYRDPVFDDAGHVLVNELEGAHSNRDQEDGLCQLEQCDQPQELPVSRFHGKGSWYRNSRLHKEASQRWCTVEMPWGIHRRASERGVPQLPG